MNHHLGRGKDDDQVIAKPKAKKQVRMVVVITVSSAGAFLIGLALAFIAWKTNKQKTNIGANHEEDLEIPLFDLGTIAFATNNFCIDNKLGEGGFGSVYKGMLKDGQEIAVKRLSKDSKQGFEEFRNEVMNIAKLQHRNLVKLLGYCMQADEIMLIYEFMRNRSLDFFIFDETQSSLLDWPKRFHIIEGIARGLLYLHQDSRLRIIHRDLKAGNILLDDEMNPKISDFGLSRSFSGNEMEANTQKVYTIDGLYSPKSDVFSFGVMLLEIVSGKKNRGFCHSEHNHNLLGHAWRQYKEGRSSELIASSFRDVCDVSEVLRSIHIGLLCVQQSSKDRPNMSTVVLMLGGEASLPEPKQPGFFTEREIVDGTTSSNDQKPCSPNVVTISTLGAR